MSKLKQMRSLKRMHLKEIADAVGVTPQTVQQMEQCGIKKNSTAKKYAKAFGCEWQELVED